MGNYMSCTSLVTPVVRNTRAARVIVPGGEIRQFRERVKAAEVMLECSSNCFLVNSKSLNIGKRFSALSADDDLESGNVYIMFPMKRVNAIVTAADMAVVLMAANSAAKRISGGKVKPEVIGGIAAAVESVKDSESERPRFNSDEIEELQVPEYRYRLAACRSKKPVLDTITEEPVYSR